MALYKYVYDYDYLLLNDFDEVFVCIDENAVAEGSSKQVSVWEDVWTDVTPGLYTNHVIKILRLHFSEVTVNLQLVNRRLTYG